MIVYKVKEQYSRQYVDYIFVDDQDRTIIFVYTLGNREGMYRIRRCPEDGKINRKTYDIL